MGNSDPQPTTTTTQQILTPEQNELISLSMPGFRQFAASPPKRYAGDTVAGFDPSQVAGQEQALTSAGQQDQLARAGADASKFRLTDALKVESNPYIGGYMDAATRPITQALTEQQLPSIRGSAVSTGNFGSSRQGIAEGLASGRASQAIGDTTSRIASDAYGKGLDAQGQALGLLPQTQQAQTAGAATTSGVGDVRQAMQQALINEKVTGYNYDQMLPFLVSQELAGVAGGLPGGGAISTGTQSQGPSGASRALGGAASGAALGSAFMPGVGTAVGAGLGGLVGFLR